MNSALEGNMGAPSLDSGSDGTVWVGGKSVDYIEGHNAIHVDIEI